MFTLPQEHLDAVIFAGDIIDAAPPAIAAEHIGASSDSKLN